VIISSTTRATPKLPELPQTKWRPRHHIGIYDYNWKVGESYYNPQTSFIGTKPVQRTPANKPPEAQTFAERYAAAPIYGSAYGLPYDESQSVFNKPCALITSGTRRSQSASRPESETSRYLASLRPKEPFKRDDCQLFRQTSLSTGNLAAPKSALKKTPSGNSLESASERQIRRFKEEFDSYRSPRGRVEEKKVSFKHETGPSGREVVKREETTVSSGGYYSDSLASKPPVSLRPSRKSSVGSTDYTIPSSRFENSVKFSSQQNVQTEGSISKYKNAQQFRDIKRRMESDALSDQIRKTLNQMSSPSRREYNTFASSSAAGGMRSRAVSFSEPSGFMPRSRLNSLSSRLSRH